MRFTPSPNVLVELGYAATVVGWENIICLFDSDYGVPKDLPLLGVLQRIAGENG